MEHCISVSRWFSMSIESAYLALRSRIILHEVYRKATVRPNVSLSGFLSLPRIEEEEEG